MINKIKTLIKETIASRHRLKILTVCMIIFFESVVLIGAAFAHAPSVGIIRGADGPTTIFIAKTEDNRLVDWFIKVFSGKLNSQSDNPNRPPDDGRDNLSLDGNNYKKATESQIQEAREKGLLILINKKHPVDKDYKPDDLAPIKYFASDRSEAGRYMRKEAADQFHKLVEGAAVEEYKIVMTTAYRSYGFQKVLWNNYVSREGEAAASRFSARPGTSEHQSGLAVDVSSPSVGYALTEQFGETKEGKWLAHNAHNYGFIIRFPKEKEDITGYLYEPWHIRYVGEPVATEIYSRGITLEEYLDQ